ncbi:MAG TPA: Gfo/Idh/MocA family oxidoreductase [Chloroflexia bacterium]|nr:Gfo/Idh/MocA family oxidoreductase [Chloroflexia bacterium]
MTAPDANAAPFKPVDPTRPVRVAVIGAGAMGRNHLRVLNDLEQVDLVATADADEETARRAARRFGIEPYGDFRAMLDEQHPDAVVVAVPTHMHRDTTLAAIERGAHVLVEKPIAFAVEDGQEMIRSAREAGLLLTVGHIERYNPAVVELYRRLQAGELGRVFQIHARRLGPFPPRVRDVGVVIDLATHDVDIMRYLTGSEVTRVYAETARRIHTDHEDLVSGLLRFADNSIGVLDINWLTPTKIRELMVTGEKGMFLVNYLTQDLYFYENNYVKSDWDAISRITGVSEGDMLRLRIDKVEPLKVELEHFVRAVRGEDVQVVSGADGLEALRIVRTLVQSGLDGTVISIQDEGEGA